MDNFCTYCSVIVGSEAELRAHCNSESHQLTIMSDEGREWKFRAPARGVGSDQYTLCMAYSVSGKCRFGQQCCDAHGEDELNEWKERYDYRQMKLQGAKECRLQGCHYTEQLLEKWLSSSNPNHIMTESLDTVDITVEPDLNLTLSEKNSRKEWIFHISAKAPLRHIALLYETHRSHFEISQLMSGRSSDIKEYNLGTQCQEWSNADNCDYNDDHYTCKVQFVTSIYGTFRQAIVFDFGFEPVLVQKLCVDVVSNSDMEKLQQARDTAVSFTERWSNNDVSVVPFENRPYPLGEKEECLLTCYPAPNGSKFTITQNVIEPTLTKDNYCARQHELLCIEEMAQYELLSRYNVKAHLNLTSCCLLTPNSAVTAKYAHNGELFANMKLSSVLSEDSASGRLVLTNCSTVLLAPVKTKGEENRKVYEAIIEDKGKTVIYIRLSKRCCEELRLKADRELLAEVQFQLNRLPLCEMHFAVDRLHPPSLVFPDVTIVPQLWSMNTNWAENLDPRLNPKQKEAVQAITTPLSMRLPPVLIIGPFGTGKTFTLSQAVKMILEDPQSRILVCTHSNSAADIYIREYLHPQVAEGRTEATPLRIYYRHRWVATVHPTVQQYCLVSSAGSDRTFNMPTVDDVKKHKVIVTTLSTAKYLVQLGLEKGFFTHILIDEAAQAMECEVIMPLSLANENTRIVLAGDHMQLSPEVYSQFAQQRNLHTSLLERLYDLYPEDYTCKVLLCENYRSHEAIIQYTSELFYDNHLQASGQQPRHKKYYPLTFFTARGEDVQDCNSTAFHNNAEVFEIVERVIELKKNWPKSWGEQDETSVGVVSPYYDQVVRIRAELRKKKLHGVSVERVLNVQGKQFRVIFLSAVRTRQTCMKSKPESDLDHGFLSNARLLNTAITRAQSLVAVVGDPVSLCSVGKCRKLWEKFIFTCHKEKSLFGITWDSLRSQLDSMELKKNFILNPLAPEFIPGRMYHGQPSSNSPVNEFCPNNPPPQPWFLFPFASPFQGPPIMQPAMTAMFSAPHPYNNMMGLCPSIMPPSHNNPFPNFPFNAQTPQLPPQQQQQQQQQQPQPSQQQQPQQQPQPQQRPANLPQRMSPAAFPRKISNRSMASAMEPSPPQLKDFDRGLPVGRQIKRSEAHLHFNAIQKQQPFGRVFEERHQNDAEDLKRVINRGSEQHHTNFGLINEPSESILNIQNLQFNMDEKRGKHFNFSKPDEIPNAFIKQNMQGSVDMNGLGALDHSVLQMNKPTMNGTWCPLPSKPFPDSELQSGISLNSNSTDGDNMMRAPFNDLSCLVNERERLNNSTPFNSSQMHPNMMYQHQNNSQFPEKWFNHVETPQVSNRLEVPASNLALIHIGLQQKVNFLEKILPSGTDIVNFLESEDLTKGFLHHLLSSEGVHAARKFIILLMGIKRDQELLVKNQQLNGHINKSLMSQRYSSPSRSMSDSPASMMRNVPSTQQFLSPRPQITNNYQQSESFNNAESFGLDSPNSPFSLPRILSVDKVDSGLFSNNEMGRQEQVKSAMNVANPAHWSNENNLCMNNMPQNRPSQDQLAYEMSKLFMSNRIENRPAREVGIPEDNGFCPPSQINVRRQLEFERAHENHEKAWPALDQNSLQAAPELGSSQGSYLSRLRNISSSVGNWENSYSLLFDTSRSEERAARAEFEMSNHMTAGPLSMSYPDIPDILSSHILPNGKESTSSKVIRKPTRSSEIPTSNSSQFMFDISMQQNNGTSLRYPQLSSEGMTYAKILRSHQQ